MPHHRIDRDDRKFIDSDAEIVYLPADNVLPYAERSGAISFDALYAWCRREVAAAGGPT